MESHRAQARANAVFAALSNADRRKILDLLREGEKAAGEVCGALPSLPQPDVSRHLRVLRDAGLVNMRPRGQKRIYQLQPDKLREVDGWVSLYREFWSGRLNSLEAHLGGDERK
jgi:DNA-binding transcriptional ArsR family regulator